MTGWEFQRFGGLDQLVLRSADDLERIDTLDEARWSATSMPIDGLELDAAFLAFLDDDGNGRVRVEEMKAARAWLWERLSGRSHLAEHTDTVFLADIDPTHEGAKVLRALAVRLLSQLDASHRDHITLGEVRSFKTAYASKFPNGDGVVTPDQVADPALAAFVTNVVAVTGGAQDLSGAAGASEADVDAWVERVRAFAAWKSKATDEADAIFPLGDATAAADALVAALAPKMSQFFAQCALMALEAGAEARLQATPEQLAALDVSDPAAIAAWMAVAPLARPNAAGLLSGAGLNAAYAAEVRRVLTEVATPLLGRDVGEGLELADWKAIETRLAPYRAWLASRPMGIADDADIAALVSIADGPLPAAARALAAQDKEIADELVAFRDLEKLVLYHRGLLQLANNLVSFAALFDREELAVFQDGVLILDGRRMDLCLRVTNKAAHKPIAESSLTFLAYCDLTRQNEGGAGETRTIVAAVTAGTRGGISVGKRGVFYDRAGLEWDALVTDVIVQPISIWEAMVAPFVRVRDMVSDRLKGLVESKTADAEGAAAAHAAAPPAPPAAPAGGGNMQTLLIGGSVAFAALGSTLAFVIQTLSSIDVGSLMLTLLLVGGALAALSALLGWLKLRRRDLSAILEAGGWALNGRMLMSTWLGARFTERPRLPKGAKVRRIEPGNTLAWVGIVLAALLVATAVAFWKLPDLAPWLRGEVDSPWGAAIEPAAEAVPAAPDPTIP